MSAGLSTPKSFAEVVLMNDEDVSYIVFEYYLEAQEVYGVYAGTVIGDAMKGIYVQHMSSSESHGQPNLLLPKGKRKLDEYVTVPVAHSPTNGYENFTQTSTTGDIWTGSENEAENGAAFVKGVEAKLWHVHWCRSGGCVRVPGAATLNFVLWRLYR